MWGTYPSSETGHFVFSTLVTEPHTRRCEALELAFRQLGRNEDLASAVVETGDVETGTQLSPLAFYLLLEVK